MGNRKTLFVLLSIFVVFTFFYPKPKNKKIVVNEILFAEPLFFRALTNYTHTLIADRLWLLSNTVGEIATGDSFNVDENEVYLAFRMITYMDPCFYPALNYAATYLASIKKRVDLATDLIKTARMFNQNDFKLYFLEMVLILTYKNFYDIDYDYIAKLAMRASFFPDKQKRVAQIVVKEWLKEIFVYAKDKKKKKSQTVKDLNGF